jgi:hypothetical protein
MRKTKIDWCTFVLINTSTKLDFGFLCFLSIQIECQYQIKSKIFSLRMIDPDLFLLSTRYTQAFCRTGTEQTETPLSDGVKKLL